MTAVQEVDFKRLRSNEEDQIVKDYKEAYDLSFRAWSPFLQEANKDLRCYLGDQWDHRDREYLQSQRRNALVFNRVRRNVKMITGYERRTRHSLIARPVENADELLADQMSGLMLWAANHDNMMHTTSDAFEGALKTGINLLSLSMDYSKDPVFGDVKLARLPYNSFLLDPKISKRDLSDCEFIIQRRLLGKDSVKALLPFRADDIDLLASKGDDGKFPNMQGHGVQGKDALRYDEYWRRCFKDVKILVDRETGEVREFDSKKIDLNRLKQFVEGFPQIELISKQVPTVELNVMVEGRLMWAGGDPNGINDFPHVPIMAFWDPEYSDDSSSFVGGMPGNDDYSSYFSRQQSSNFALKLQSLVRCVRDPQTEANKRRSKMLDIIDSQVNTGWQAKANSVVNPKDMYQASQGKVIWMKEEAQMNDAFRLHPPDIPNGLFQLSNQMDNDIVEIAGITDELLGMQDDGSMQMSGVLAKLRQGAGLTVLQDLFDNYRLAQKGLGTKMMQMIQANWDVPKAQRILNAEVSPAIFGDEQTHFDIVVEEAMETSTQKALAYTQLLQARQVGIPVPDSVLIDYMPLQDKAGLREAMDAERQQQQLVQQQQLEDQARLRELQRSKVFSDIGLGVERMARAEADRGLAQERISEMQENNADAILKRVKAVKEIENMDTDRLLRLVEFARELEQRQKAEALAVQQAQTQNNEATLQQVMGFVTDQNIQQPGLQ